MLDSIKRFFGFFDSTGLRYSAEHLDKIKRAIALYPLDKQAKYADKVCVVNIHNDRFVSGQMEELNPDDQNIYWDLNATAIGNMAFISLHANNPKYRAKAQLILANYSLCVEKFYKDGD